MSLVRVKRSAQITLPAEVRKALRLKEGDYLEAAMVDNGVLLRPVEVVDRDEADRQLEAILARVKHIGPGPAPSDDDLMEMVVEEIHALRREDAESGSR